MSALRTRPISSNSLGDVMKHSSLERIANRYREDGYDVVVNPQGEQVPPFASGFSIDLIASRGGENVVVVVKSNRSELSKDSRIVPLAGVIDKQPGWRLDVVILDSESEFERAAQDADEPSDDQISEIFHKAVELSNQGMLDYACVVAWSGVEAVMRRLRDEAEFSTNFKPYEVMRSLYSHGILSRQQFDRLKEGFKIRNQVVHGLIPSMIDPHLVHDLTLIAQSILSDRKATIPAG